MGDRPTSTPELAAAIRELCMTAAWFDHSTGENVPAAVVIGQMDEPHRSLLRAILDTSIHTWTP